MLSDACKNDANGKDDTTTKNKDEGNLEEIINFAANDSTTVTGHPPWLRYSHLTLIPPMSIASTHSSSSVAVERHVDEKTQSTTRKSNVSR